jgi:ATP-binding cassette subfamily F protein uup
MPSKAPSDAATSAATASAKVLSKASSKAAPNAAAKGTGTPSSGGSRDTRQAAPPRGERKKRLSFKETAELADLPARIDIGEKARDAAYAALADPAVLRDADAVIAARETLARVEAQLQQLLARWESLETIASEG